VVAKAYGIPVSRVTLFIFGGVAHIAQEPRRPLVELVVALAGPLVSVVIAAGCFWAAGALTPSDAGLIGLVILRYLAVVNTAIVVFNLLPGFPLDGGRLLRAALWAWSGDLRRATRIAGALGHGLGVALMGLGLMSLLRGHWINGVWYVLLGMFLRNAARVSSEEAVG
jgi:Zn-dependent protease